MGEGWYADVEDERCEGIELVLGKARTRAQVVEVGFDWLYVLKEVFVGLRRGDGVAWFHSGGVAVADGPDAGRAAIGGEAEAFELADEEVSVWRGSHGCIGVTLLLYTKIINYLQYSNVRLLPFSRITDKRGRLATMCDAMIRVFLY